MAKKVEAKKSESKAPESSQQEQIGFHKGSLMTLAKERQELVRILNIVEQLMQMHGAALQEMGVKLDAETQQAAAPAPQGKKPPIEDIL